MIDILVKCGLKDSNGIFAQELESWDVFYVGDDRDAQLRGRCADSLDK